MMSLEQIEARLDDSIKNGTDSDIHYWRGYRDAVAAMQTNNAKKVPTAQVLQYNTGKPVFITQNIYGKCGRYALVIDLIGDHVFFRTKKYEEHYAIEDYDKTWTAYYDMPDGFDYDF